MPHIDPEQLALLAMDEPVESPDDRAHLAACPACTADLVAMRHAAVVGRAAVDDSGLETPPDRVWLRISEELDLGDRPSTTDADSENGSRPQRLGGRAVWVLAASLAFVVALGAGVWAMTNAVRPTTVAAASLTAFPDHPGAEGTATVEKDRDGTVRLTVSLDGDAVGDGYREVWLIRGDASALISLGILDGEEGTFVVPEGVDLSEYRLVDVSVEPLDGDPLHSGDSIVRGELETA